MEFVKNRRVVWRIEEWQPSELSAEEKAQGLLVAQKVLCLIAQDLQVEDATTGASRMFTLGRRNPTQKPVGSPGTPATELLGPQDAAALSSLLATALNGLCTVEGVLVAAPTIDDEIASVQAKLADALARKQAAIDAAMLAEAEAAVIP